ncbi:DUF3048 domain-containing protein [Candidatus Falkowbacteria bacterium]|nr:DUF3048 domain-containing protein [Candidatus Falkowbacteria bacterium]
MSNISKEEFGSSEPNIIDKAKNFFKNRTKLWKILMIASVALFLFCSIILAKVSISYFKTGKITTPELLLNDEQKKDDKQEAVICNECARRKIDGVYVHDDMVDPPLAAAMIDNHFNARPPIGLDKASLVIEAEVEGRFTRYLAVFDTSQDIDKIGPIRSARPYFVDWAQGLNALYCHCGGSPQALAEIIQKDINDLNEFYNAPYYWRDKSQSAPHNIYTSTEKLRILLEKQEINNSDLDAWSFKDDQALSEPQDTVIMIDFPPNDFKVRWEYKKENNAYLRYLGGEKHLTADDQEIISKNIIIQRLPAQVIDDKLRLEMETLGQGQAMICLDGQCLDGYWDKPSLEERTKFYYEDESEVSFNAGTTWIEVVRPDVEIRLNDDKEEL